MTNAKAQQNGEDAFDVQKMASLRHWGTPEETEDLQGMEAESIIDCGWGRLIFGQTFASPEMLASVLQSEKPGQRDVALYMRDPHVVQSYAPQDLFLDPSYTFRLALEADKVTLPRIDGYRIRTVDPAHDEPSINRIYQSRGMVPVYDGFYAAHAEDAALRFLVAEDTTQGQIIGVVTGVDHKAAFNDPDNGSSLWSLAVDPQTPLPGVGEALSRALAQAFQEAGRAFMDLSVMHDNEFAIALYEKLGFERVPVYCLKNKNSINEKLFIGPAPEDRLNVYARIIIDEARRRGISVEIDDAEGGLFTLTLGGRSIACRESLSELTTAVAMSKCDDKAVTHRILEASGLKVPQQIIVTHPTESLGFLKEHKRVVVKPARGEQGQGVHVDLSTEQEVVAAIQDAQELCEKVVIEQFVEGQDLRIIVINDRVVAGAVRRPAQIKGDGVHDVKTLIEKQSRRRSAATDGESHIPIDEETRRCLAIEGVALDDILPEGKVIDVRKTANLHTGGTIHDVTDRLHPVLVDAAIKAAQAIDIPVVGLDMIVPAVTGPGYVIIEANERPGLANHEPQPTAERFIDLLFPQSKAMA